MTGARWTEADVPDQRGRTVVVTGANSGLGFETARVLAERGATVVLACRNPDRAAAAEARITATAPKARVVVQQLDLASLASVHRAAKALRANHPRIDLLINNAGGIRLHHALTEDGFELTLATNHLGPFAFTGLLLDRLLETPGSRVVTVSSIGHRHGRMNFADLNAERGYSAPAAYFQAKLANLLFTYALQRRLAASGAETIALAAHPGNARTELVRDLPAPVRALMSPRLRPLTAWALQSPEMGALSILRAATDPNAAGGSYYGPPGLAQFTGRPTRVESNARSHDAQAQQRLWEESERLTGVTYPG
ncbi:oxidoreductase [Streptomyces sp. NPDC001435]|uniref:oxidoreductase n=1 Tax=unclassified Streptomyces TaxID=2593676 RepID=UPI0036B30D91